MQCKMTNSIQYDQLAILKLPTIVLLLNLNGPEKDILEGLAVHFGFFPIIDRILTRIFFDSDNLKMKQYSIITLMIIQLL